MDVENGSMHEMSVGGKKEMWKCSSVLSNASCRHVSLCSMCDGERSNCFIQENCTISFNCSTSSFSTARPFRKLSLWCSGYKTMLAELPPWRTLKISEIFSFIWHRSLKLRSYHYDGEALQLFLPSPLPLVPAWGELVLGRRQEPTSDPSLPWWGELSCSKVPQLQRGSGGHLCGPPQNAI